MTATEDTLVEVDVVVIGGGVVGCAVAERLARAGLSLVLLEREARLGCGITARNSGVVHSGLYYPAGSLKARACIEGQARLYAWCEVHRVPHRRLGKLVVAKNPAELEALDGLAANAHACGATVEWLEGAALHEREPEITGLAALWCPNTGIVDAHALTVSLANAAEAAGATVLTHAPVEGVEIEASGFRVVSGRGVVRARRLVNCAGLHADEVAAWLGLTELRIHPCRGDYFWLRGAPHYRHLIYPVQAPGDLGLGVHVTLDLAGNVRLGPDSEYVSAKDDFRPRADKLDAFHRAAERLLGRLPRSALQYEGCGLRPKLRAPGETRERDFVIREQPAGAIHLLGIDSPGLTAALSLAEEVWARSRRRDG